MLQEHGREEAKKICNAAFICQRQLSIFSPRYQWNSVDPWQLEGGNDIGNKYTRSILDVDWAGKLISEGFKAVGQETELYISWEPFFCLSLPYIEILIYI